MGEQDVQEGYSGEVRRAFTKALLDDLRTFERILASGRVESGVQRVGAEQEMFLIDRDFEPASVAPELLEDLQDERFTTELGRYNLEANLAPMVFGGDFLSRLHTELTDINRVAREAAAAHDADVLLIGILPTLQRPHLRLDHMTPVPRYFELNRTMTALVGGRFRTSIRGVDELKFEHDNLMLEACNTSFQLHWQTSAESFAQAYNHAQLITAPLLACAVNSPVLLNRRLWHETRIALFEQSVDVRDEASAHRGQAMRVGFGEGWVNESIIELFQENVADHKVLMTRELGEPSSQQWERGQVPAMQALMLHNGTVYRWNRPCYGVVDNVPHLRIENRVLPAGPTVVDEVANAALFFGLMAGLPRAIPDPRTRVPFDSVRANFVAAARQGMYAGFHWLDDKDVPADVLLKEQLLPIARDGLLAGGTDPQDVDRYMDILEERVGTRRTGALWFLQSLDQLASTKSAEAKVRKATEEFAERQHVGKPVHTWTLVERDRVTDWRKSFRRVEQIMSSKLFTVGPDDVIDLAASLMDWKHIRHIPVEEDGKLVGLLTSRMVMRMVARGAGGGDIPVRDVMITDVITVSPDDTPLHAVDLMREKKLGALPVVDNGRLVGIVSEHDFLDVARDVLREVLGT